MKKNSRQMLERIAACLYNKKATNLLAIDVRNITQMMDFIIFAEGNVDRHLEALANEVKHTLSETDEKPLYIEGTGDSGWVVIDCFEVIVHLFLPKIRDIYRIEQIYKLGTDVDFEDLDPKEGLTLRGLGQ